MREEDSIRYYEEGEKVITFVDWYNGLTFSAKAIAYEIDCFKGLVSVMAEPVTGEGNKKILDLLTLYDKDRCIILNAEITSHCGCSLVPIPFEVEKLGC